jgi:uncharacterized phage protein (TIGR01671 family)
VREIKFRAWDIETKEMSYDFLSKNWLKVCVESPYVELMQYTGLKDRNGNEIYEADVFPPGERTRGEVTVVCYDSKQAKYKAVPLSLYKANAGSGGWTGFGFEVNTFSEVIGNIHEHPHLLKGEEA